MELFSKSWGGVLSRALLWLLFPGVVIAIQLPPEIEADRFLLQAEIGDPGIEFRRREDDDGPDPGAPG